MGKNTQPLSGQSQRKFFRVLFQSDPGVTAEAAGRLTEACAAEIASIRVRLPMIVRRPLKSAVAAAQPAAVAATAVPTPQAAASVAGGGDFDPHAFSLIVVMRKGGADALLNRLATVGDITQLHAIAKAQHVAVDAALADRAAILTAIVEGTERRIAHRQAAAS
jgi:hypothetical protein